VINKRARDHDNLSNIPAIHVRIHSLAGFGLNALHRLCHNAAKAVAGQSKITGEEGGRQQETGIVSGAHTD